MATAEDQGIESIINVPAVEKQLKDLDSSLDVLETRLKNFPKIEFGNSAANLKEYAAQAKAYAAAQKAIAASNKEVSDAEKVIAAERKRVADERTQQARLAKADLQLEQVEVKKKALAEKEAAALSKQAAAAAVEAGRERLQILRAEKEAAEAAAAAEEQRNAAEQTALSGTFNPGSGAKQTPKVNEPVFVPTNELDKANLQLVQYSAQLEKNQAAQKSLKSQLEEGTISQQKYNEQIVVAKRLEGELKESISLTAAEVKLLNKIDATPAGTQAAARLENKKLIAQREVIITDPSEVENIKKLNEQIDKNNELIDANSDKLSKQKINIGNYPTAFTSAFKTLNTELDNVNKKIASGASGKELEALTIKQTALNNVIQATGKDFATTNAQQGAFKEAAKQIGAVYGTNSTVFKSFNKEVGAGSKALQDVSKEVSAAAGGSGKLTTGFKNIFGALRNIANIIPGLGIGSFVLLLLTPLQLLAEGFINMFKAISDGKERVRALNEVNEKAVAIYSEEKSKVVDLTAVAKDNTLSLGARQEALKELIALNPQYLKGLTLENIATAEGTKILDAYITSLQRKAELQAAQTVQADANKTVADLEAQRAALVELAKTGKASYNDLSEAQLKFFDNSTSTGRINFTASLLNLDIPKTDFDEALKNIDKELKKASLKVNASISVFKEKFVANFEGAGAAGQLGIIQKLRDEIERLTKIQPTLLTEADITTNVQQIKKLQDELDRLLGKEKNKRTAAVRESTKATLDSDFEIQKIAQQRKIQLLEEGVNDESKTFDQRIALLQDFTNESLALNDAQTANDKAVLEKQLAAQQANLKKAKATERNNLLIEIQNTQTKIKLLEAKNFDERLKILDNNQKKFTEVEKSAIAQDEALRKAQYEKELADAESGNSGTKAALSRQYEDRLEALNEAFLTEKITKKKFNEEREKLDFDYQVQSIRNELAYAKKILEIQKAFGIDTTKQQEAIAKLASELEAIIGKNKLDAKGKEIQDDEEFAKRKKELYKQLYSELGSTIAQFLDDGLKREEQNLDERKRLLDEDTKKRINDINQLGLTEVERVKRVSEVEKNAQFQTEQIEKRKRAIAVERAKFEKAANIANIIQSTAVAVINQLGAKPPGPQNFVLAALIGAIGALQLAKAISTPLPKYKHGRGPGKDEMAITGDGGVHEFIKHTDGSIEMTPNVPTLTPLAAGDIVYKDLAALTRAMIGATLMPLKSTQQHNHDGSADIVNELKRTTRAVKEMKNIIVVKNTPDIKSTAWYAKHIRGN